MLRILEKLMASVPLINMTLTGSVIILFVFLARLCLRKAPKVYAYVLWGAVLFRLLCPVSISAPVSALNVVRPEITRNENSVNLTMYVANTVAVSQTFENRQSIPAEVAPDAAEEKQTSHISALSVLWAAGFLVMGLQGLDGFLRLRRRLIGAVAVSPGVYLADGIDTPFVLGILRPKIYLPTGLPMAQRPFILAHERYHIRRLDMVWKLLGYLALCLHWFNPLVWLAFVLAGKDMEMSCDEAVLRNLDKSQHAQYASALLQLATNRRVIAGTPLAFGEGDVKGRIRNLAGWKKPKVWVTLLCVMVCLGAAIAFLTNPADTEKSGSGKYELIIGERGVYSIQVTTPTGGGIMDGFPFAAGEKVTLTPMDGLASWTGVNIKALGKDGELIWEYTVPQKVPEWMTVHDGTWFLLQSGTQSANFSQVTVGPCGIFSEDLYYQIPQGVSMVTEHTDGADGLTYQFRVENSVIGGVWKFPMESEPDRDNLSWLTELKLPEWEMENIGYFADSTGKGEYSIEFFSDVPPGTPRTVLNRHYLYYYDGVLYDLWFDGLHGDETVSDRILRSVSVGAVKTEELIPQISESFDIGALPEGITYAVNQNGSISFLKDDICVGGIDAYEIPPHTFDPEDTHLIWLERSKISDFGNALLYYEGGMTFTEREWTAYFTAENPKTERHHRFQVAGNYIYDTWFNSLQIDYETRQQMLRASRCTAVNQLPDEAHTLHSQSDEEESAYQTIAAFLNGLQENQAAYIVQNRQPIGSAAPGARSDYFYLAEGDYYWNKTEMLPDGNMQETAMVMVDGSQYSGTSAVFGDDLVWRESREEFSYPWLGGIDWNRQGFQYVATMDDSNGTVYLYHSSFWFEEDEGGYFINFCFDAEGRFDHVTIRVNQFMDNDYEVTETIQSTDSAAIKEWIGIEHRKALENLKSQ